MKTLLIFCVWLLNVKAWATLPSDTQACMVQAKEYCVLLSTPIVPGDPATQYSYVSFPPVYGGNGIYWITNACQDIVSSQPPNPPIYIGTITCSYLADGPQAPLPTQPPPLINSPAIACGSIIKVDSRSVGEQVPITGTKFSLSYSSDRILGRKADYKIRIPITGSAPVSTLTTVNLTVNFAGRVFTKSFTRTANQFYDFVWDGLDQSGKYLAGVTTVKIKLQETHSSSINFNWPTEYSQPLGGRNALGDGLGGWSIDVHHAYDPIAKKIYYGNGSMRSQEAADYQGATRYFLPNEDGSEGYIFDRNGRHLQTLNGLTGTVLLTFNYDSQGRISSIVDSYNNKTEIVRDVSGNLTGIKSHYGQITKLVMGTTGYLYSVSNPKSETYTFVYGSNGLLTKFTKPGGEITTFSYDADGYLTEDNTAGSFIRLLQTVATESTKTIEKSSPLGRKTKYEVSPLDSNGGVYRTEIRPDGVSSYFNDTQNYKYSSSSDGSSSTESFGNSSRFSYLVFDKVYGQYSGFNFSITDGITETVETQDYFSFGLLTRKRTIQQYDPTYEASETSTFHSTTRLGVNTSFGGRASKYSLDAFGKLTSTQWASYQPVSFTYDTRGRISQIKQYLRTTTLGYDAFGNIASIKDPAGLITSYTYDAANRKTQTMLADGRVINFNYDKTGNLISLTPPSKPIHSFLYTALGFISKYLAPSLVVGGATLDTTYTYSLDKELTQIMLPDGSLIKFNYDPVTALLTSVTSSLGSTSYIFQNGTLSQPTEIKTPDGVIFTGSYYSGVTAAQSGLVKGSILKNYDTLGRVSSATVSGALSTDTSLVEFKYDKDSLMTNAGTQSLAYSATTAKLSSSKLVNVTDSYAYDAYYGELSSYLAKYTTTNLFSESVTRDVLGRIISRTEVISGVTHTYAYTYDAAGRLSTVKIDGVLRSQYDYDTNSNRVKSTFIGTSATSVLNATYDNQDRILTYGSYVLSHDANGYLTSQKLLTFTPDTFTYDVFGNLRSASLPMASKTINYIIDGFNRRVGRKVNGILKQMFVYQNQLQIAAELDAAGKIVSRFVYSSKSNIPDFIIKAGVTYRIISDHLGSPRMVVNASTGAIAQKMDFNEFGRVTLDTAPGFQPFGFAGGIYDLDTKLVRFGARDYNAEMGRWMAKDPILFVGSQTNLYGYVFSDPVNFIDPDGLFPKDLDEAGECLFGNTDVLVNQRRREIENLNTELTALNSLLNHSKNVCTNFSNNSVKKRIGNVIKMLDGKNQQLNQLLNKCSGFPTIN